MEIQRACERATVGRSERLSALVYLYLFNLPFTGTIMASRL